MGTNPIRYVWFGLAVVVAAATLLMAPWVVRNQQAARAEEIRSRCVRELASKRSWHADIVETETGSDGKRAIVRQQILVRRPGEYRLTVRETDEHGGSVVLTSIRAKGAFYAHRTNADGSTELHVVRGERPSLGVELDNLLGQTVQAISEAKPLKIVGRETRDGRAVDKLALGAGRFVWVDQTSGLPVGEQVVSDGAVAHDVVITQFQAEAPAPDSEFAPSSLGAADATVTEDLGFRPAANPAAAAAVVGFAPCAVPTPIGYREDVEGYVDPRVKSGEGPAEAAYVSAFSNGTSGVVVTQTHASGIGESFVDGSGVPDGAERLDLGGTPALYYSGTVHPQLVFVRRGVLVTIEGDLPESAMRELAQRIL
jgi:outer membrane lipoprotein-sorting protein